MQPVDATDGLNIAAAVQKPGVFLGLSFHCLAMASGLACA
jgi:hypothetical protein